jgi:hypothetical protein
MNNNDWNGPVWHGPFGEQIDNLPMPVVVHTNEDGDPIDAPEESKQGGFIKNTTYCLVCRTNTANVESTKSKTKKGGNCVKSKCKQCHSGKCIFVK